MEPEKYTMSSEEIVDALMRVLERSMVPNTPKPPTASCKKPVIEVDDCNVHIRFGEYPNPEGTTYCIYRSRDAPPIINAESHPLTEVPATSVEYVNRALEPGVAYHYQIFAKRSGVMSKDFLGLGPVFVVPNARDISIEDIPGGFRIAFGTPQNASKVRIWRADDPKGSGATELHIGDKEVYEDLVGCNKGCYYIFVTEYLIDGKVERSDFKVVHAVKNHHAVAKISISKDDKDGTYRATWAAGEDIALYYMSTPMLNKDCILGMSDVSRWMDPVEVIETYPDGVRFNIPDDPVEYIYPITKAGKLVMVGEEVLVTNLDPFRGIKYSVQGNDCIITIPWPEDVISARLVVSGDCVKSMGDASAVTYDVEREKQSCYCRTKVDMGQRSRLFINAYAIYTIDGKELSSEGVVFEVRRDEPCTKAAALSQGDHAASQQASLSDDAGILFDQGFSHYFGRGVSQSFISACECYAKAAGLGHESAQFCLGCMYYDGKGVAQSRQKAVELFKTAAKSGHAGAKDALEMIEKGESMPDC